VFSSKQQQFGLEKSQKLTALCRHCEFRKLCYGGCPKHRFVSLENEPNPHNYLCASYRYFFEKTAKPWLVKFGYIHQLLKVE